MKFQFRISTTFALELAKMIPKFIQKNKHSRIARKTRKRKATLVN